MAAADLRAHVEGRSALRLGELAGGLHDLRDAKVAQLDNQLAAAAATAKEDVGGLEVAVEQLEVVVAVGECCAGWLVK